MGILREIADFTPFAVVTPDGEWHDQEELGRWGVVKYGQGASDWPTIYRRIINSDRVKGEDKATLVDCHL